MTRHTGTTLLIIIHILVTGVFTCSPNSNGRAISSGGASSSSSPQMDTDREYLIRDAISWMTIRDDGKLLTKTQLRPIFETVRDVYLQSSFYKTFVIAFQYGVLPKLTLNEGDPCDPKYIESYRDPSNYSVTYYYQKKFIFDNFDKSISFSAYCDYRQGLVCDPTQKKCKCPKGSMMELADPASPSTKRCLLQQNEICPLIDLSHSLDNAALLGNLPHMIFNLEKPLGCKTGTQCRFKDKAFPKCYSNDEASSFKTFVGDESLDKKYGRMCTLDLIAQPGSCEAKTDYRPERGPNGYVCYNYFGKDGYSKKTGYCAHEYGPIGEIQDNPYPSYKQYYPFLAYFVNPKTTPLKGKAWEEQHKKLIQVYTNYFETNDILQWESGGVCNVNRTKNLLEMYRFYAGIPTASSKPSEALLQEKAELALQITDVNIRDKICNLIWRYEWDGAEFLVSKPMTCEPKGSGSGRGNDGKCKESSQNEEGHEVYKVINSNVERLLEIRADIEQEEQTFNQTIIDMYPEVIRPTTEAPQPPEPEESVNKKQVIADCAFGTAYPNLVFVIVTQLFNLYACT